MNLTRRYPSWFDLIFDLPLFQFATQVVPAEGSGGGEGGGTGAGNTGGGAGVPGAAGAGGGGQPAPLNWDSAPQQFRDGYNKLKADLEKLTKEYEPWQKWATESKVAPDQLGAIHGTYQQVYEEINGIAEQLGIAEDEVTEAVEKRGIVPVLNFLQRRYAEAGAGAGAGEGEGADDLDTRIEQAIATRLSPIEERENVRLTDAANQRFEQIVHQSIVEAYKAEGVDVANIPEAESFMLMNATSEILKYDDKALTELKQGKGQAAIQKAFQQAKGVLDNYYISRSGRERGRIQGPPKVKASNGQERKPTLDELIEEPTLINPRYKVGA